MTYVDIPILHCVMTSGTKLRLMKVAGTISAFVTLCHAPLVNNDNNGQRHYVELLAIQICFVLRKPTAFSCTESG